MENLQVHYLVQLATAKENALQGNITDCLNRCFELRLKPNLALYTRALVCLTICDLVAFEDYPQKLNIAYEALRLAVELKAENNPRKDVFWTAEHDRLESDADDAVKEAETEELEFMQSIFPQFFPDESDDLAMNISDLTLENASDQAESTFTEREEQTEVSGEENIEEATGLQDDETQINFESGIDREIDEETIYGVVENTYTLYPATLAKAISAVKEEETEHRVEEVEMKDADNAEITEPALITPPPSQQQRDVVEK